MSRMTALRTVFWPATPNKTSLLGWLMAADAAYRSRVQLAGLEAFRLDDLGLNEKVAKKEARKPIWDVPAHWTK